MSSYDWLLFGHLLFAFTLVSGVVILAPYGALGRRDGTLIARVTKLGAVMAPVGGMGTLILGLILIANRDYKFFTLWILGAIVLWAVGTGTGERVAKVEDAGEATKMYWISSAALLGMLILMIFKPGA